MQEEEIIIIIMMIFKAVPFSTEIGSLAIISCVFSVAVYFWSLANLSSSDFQHLHILAAERQKASQTAKASHSKLHLGHHTAPTTLPQACTISQETPLFFQKTSSSMFYACALSAKSQQCLCGRQVWCLFRYICLLCVLFWCVHLMSSSANIYTLTLLCDN